MAEFLRKTIPSCNHFWFDAGGVTICGRCSKSKQAEETSADKAVARSLSDCQVKESEKVDCLNCTAVYSVDNLICPFCEDSRVSISDIRQKTSSTQILLGEEKADYSSDEDNYEGDGDGDGDDWQGESKRGPPPSYSAAEACGAWVYESDDECDAACTVCTFENKASAVKCEACDAAMNACTVCTFENKAFVVKCKACNNEL